MYFIKMNWGQLNWVLEFKNPFQFQSLKILFQKGFIFMNFLAQGCFYEEHFLESTVLNSI